MKSTIKIIDLFKTSIGDVAVLTFASNETPRIGLVLKNKSNFRWTISGIGGNRKLGPANKYTNYPADAIWDCVLRPLNHSENLAINELFETE